MTLWFCGRLYQTGQAHFRFVLIRVNSWLMPLFAAASPCIMSQFPGGELMNKRFALSVIAIFVLLMVFGFVVHGLLLSKDYGPITPRIMRDATDGAQHMPAMLVGQLIFAIAFVWIYLRGKEDKPYMAQGLRYGAAMAALTVAPKFLIYFAVEPLDPMLVAKQIVFDSIMTLILGVMVAALNK
jgi:hypothetical protein